MRHPDGLSNATELVAMVRELGDFCVGVAAFPSRIPSVAMPPLDARLLAEKARAGASFAITQLFTCGLFPPRRAGAVAGLRDPILPGIMPITNVSQVRRFAELSGRRCRPR